MWLILAVVPSSTFGALAVTTLFHFHIPFPRQFNQFYIELSYLFIYFVLLRLILHFNVFFQLNFILLSYFIPTVSFHFSLIFELSTHSSILPSNSPLVLASALTTLLFAETNKPILVHYCGSGIL